MQYQRLVLSQCLTVFILSTLAELLVLFSKLLPDALKQNEQCWTAEAWSQKWGENIIGARSVAVAAPKRDLNTNWFDSMQSGRWFLGWFSDYILFSVWLFTGKERLGSDQRANVRACVCTCARCLQGCSLHLLSGGGSALTTFLSPSTRIIKLPIAAAWRGHTDTHAHIKEAPSTSLMLFVFFTAHFARRTQIWMKGGLSG